MKCDTAVSALSQPAAIGYCTNVHAGPDLLATRANLERFALAVKEQISDQTPMGIGLWLSAEAADDLREQDLIEPFAQWLREVGLVPFTLNGFPYGDFHQEVVKYDVYQPAWNDPLRRDYTQVLIEILDGLLPPGMEGSISTLPLQWGGRFAASQERDEAAHHLRQIAQTLEELEQRQDRLIYVCLEPEPGCLLQSRADVVRFFEEHLQVPGEQDRIRRYIRVCHDVCHSAVMFESQHETLAHYAQAGILVGKIQVSSAVVLRLDEIPRTERATAFEQLRQFAGDRYLHQTNVRLPGQTPVFYEDLPLALNSVKNPEDAEGEWRIHFHVPIYLERFGALQTSQADNLECLQAAHQLGKLPHLEVETYAWDLLPAELKRAVLSEGIVDELRWLHQQLDLLVPQITIDVTQNP